MQELLSLTRAACEKYKMIENGDKIAVGISGGKDSLALLVALNELKRFYPAEFEITAVTLDPCFNNNPTDFSEIEKLCEEKGIEYHIKRTELYHIIFETRKEKNPCSLCARMRRGALHDMAKEYGCNKIALGHHLDDAAATFAMNLLNNSTIGCFSPVSYLSRKELYMIRPFVFVRESKIKNIVNKLNLPVVKSACPEDKHTEREEINDMLKQLSKKYPDVQERIVNAIERIGIDRW